jgi:iron complex outermembrane receptor protein
VINKSYSGWVSVSGLALVIGAGLAVPAFAQSSGTVEEVVITGSRIQVDGARAPTPVTLVSADQLQQTAPRTLTEALLKLPVLQASPSVATQGTGTTGSNGGATLNLRNLGSSRTLVLLDNRRVVAATAVGSVDVALIPEALVQRVEVVTGGASAAYGSDAVSGVVNYILDTRFKGLKVDVAAGQSEYKDNQTYRVTVAGGDSYMDDRLNVVASAEYYKSRGVETFSRRPWARDGYTGSIVNPAVSATNPASPTNPRRIVVRNHAPSNAALGGLITNTALAGTTFDPGGGARPFQYGGNLTATTMSGSPDPNAYNIGLLLVLQPPQERKAAFVHATYAVTDKLDFYVEGLLSQNDLEYNSFPTFELSQTAFTIFSDNAYLPASVRARMAAGNIPSVSVGRTSPDIAIPRLDATSRTQRFVTGFDGKLNGDWTYSAYYEYGKNHSVFKTEDDPISERLYRAADAVVNPANGQVVCRTTLTTPTDGCVPLNIFGYGSPSAASLAYVIGTAVQDVTVKQQVAEANVQGPVYQLPAGPLQVAAGVGIRKERFDQTVDALSSSIRTGTGIRGFPSSLVNTLGGYERTNPQPAAGSYTVKEVYGEVNAPLIADQPLAHSLTINGAARYTDYSTSGGVTTWKVGMVYEPTEWLRLRGTRSRDIRAPSLGELYRGSSQGTATVIDPTRPTDPPRNALTGAVGNTNIDPETADTKVFGVVLQPTNVSGLTLSADYYSIEIKDAISALSAQQTVDFCAGGATELCGFIQRDGNGQIARVQLPFFNVDARSTSGVDLEASYRFTAGPAAISLRAFATRLISFKTQVSGAAPQDAAGDANNPKWNGLLMANVGFDAFSFTVSERYYGAGNVDNTLTPTDIDMNHQDAQFYTDVTLNYQFGPTEKPLSAFLTVNNLFNKDTPLLPGGLTAGAGVSYNTGPYDKIGRMYTAGLRLRF